MYEIRALHRFIFFINFSGNIVEWVPVTVSRDSNIVLPFAPTSELGDALLLEVLQSNAIDPSLACNLSCDGVGWGGNKIK